MKPTLTIALAAVTLIAVTISNRAQGATSFSAMGIGEISHLLSEAASAKDAARHEAGSETKALPVELTAPEMVAKVYGVVDPGVNRSECVDHTRRMLSLTPEEDEGCLWLDSDAGYRINYYGLVPETSAMARFDGDALAEYCYFFLFPYEAGGKSIGVRNQADFCGTLLQEMYDSGLPMDLNTATDDLFEAVGDYQGSLVDVRLLDEAMPDSSGRFILIVSVEPNAL